MSRTQGRTRRQFLKDAGTAAISSGSLAFLSSLGLTGCARKSRRKPNVVLVMTDDQGLRRYRRAREPVRQNADLGRPPCQERPADEFPHRPLLLSDAGIPSHGPVLGPLGRLAHHRREVAARPGPDDHGRSLPVRRLPDRHLRQMASRRELSVPAAGPRFPGDARPSRRRGRRRSGSLGQRLL